MADARAVSVISLSLLVIPQLSPPMEICNLAITCVLQSTLLCREEYVRIVKVNIFNENKATIYFIVNVLTFGIKPKHNFKKSSWIEIGACVLR